MDHGIADVQAAGLTSEQLRHQVKSLEVELGRVHKEIESNQKRRQEPTEPGLLDDLSSPRYFARK